MRGDPLAEAAAAAEVLAVRTGVARHDVAVILGTGLAPAAESLGAPVARVEFAELPGFPVAVAAAQRAEAWSTTVADHRVLVFRGRPHLYEGHGTTAVAHPVRTAVQSGCHTVLITNASGGVRSGLGPGDLVLIADHLNLTGLSPLTGLPTTSGPAPTQSGVKSPSPFVDLTDAWSPRLRALARRAETSLQEGVYAQLPGPHFETPAEIRMLRTLGADLVGMSSALEAIAARHLGAEVLGLSLVTNVAAGIAPGSVGPASVVAVAHQRAPALGAVLREVLRSL